MADIDKTYTVVDHVNHSDNSNESDLNVDISDIPELSAKNVPKHIQVGLHDSRDYMACTQQNTDVLRFIPLTDLKVYTGPNKPHKFKSLFEAHKAVRDSKIPNFLGCCIPVQSQLNPAFFRDKLAFCWDKQLPDLIEFGFPSGL